MAKRKIISVLVLFLNFNSFLVDCAKILAVYPSPSLSHHIVFRILTNELVKQGHEVTVITTDPEYPKDQVPLNLTEIDVHEISYKIWNESLLNIETGKENDLYFQINTLMRAMSKIFTKQLATKDVQEIISRKKDFYDLLLLEAYVKIPVIFTHIFKAPAIHISSFGGLQYNFEIVGAPLHPLLYPSPLQQKLYNLSFYEKMQQLYHRWFIENSYYKVEEEENELLQEMFGKDVPSIRELSNNIDMLFLNTYPVWTGNQPVPANVIFIGGIHTRQQKALPNDISLILNSSTNGVIYFSLGTNVNTKMLPPEKIQVMIKVFSQLPYDIIWKCNQDSMPGITENIKLFKWVPQPDLLKHSKVKLFITQGGLQSTDEAIDAGVPLIGMPMLGDQWYNTEKYRYHQIGIKLDLPELNEEIFTKAISTVINDKSYRKNIVKLRRLIKDQTQKPLERTIWWIDYVLRHRGAKHLRAAGANITWAKYYELELVTIVLLLLFAILLLLCLSLSYLPRLILSVIWPVVKIKKI